MIKKEAKAILNLNVSRLKIYIRLKMLLIFICIGVAISVAKIKTNKKTIIAMFFFSSYSRVIYCGLVLSLKQLGSTFYISLPLKIMILTMKAKIVTTWSDTTMMKLTVNTTLVKLKSYNFSAAPTVSTANVCI